jgi:hypothetical protein
MPKLSKQSYLAISGILIFITGLILALSPVHKYNLYECNVNNIQVTLDRYCYLHCYGCASETTHCRGEFCYIVMNTNYTALCCPDVYDCYAEKGVSIAFQRQCIWNCGDNKNVKLLVNLVLLNVTDTIEYKCMFYEDCIYTFPNNKTDCQFYNNKVTIDIKNPDYSIKIAGIVLLIISLLMCIPLLFNFIKQKK